MTWEPKQENEAKQDNVKGLSCRKMDVGYGKKIILQNVELVVEPGKILTLIGPNGSGKSTILKSITRQLKLLAGTVSLSGQDMQDMSGNQIAKKMSMVMTERPRAELMTCREVVATGRYPYVGRMGILRNEDWAAVDEAMKLVHADDVAANSFLEISDGQRQRVMLARALCQEPEVLVLDEPTSFLDMRYKLDILTSIRRLASKKQIAVIMSLHELELAMKVSDTIACVDHTSLSAVGTPEEIFSGDRIQKLYGVKKEEFNPLTGEVYFSGEKESPKVFVIGGGGFGIQVYHKLVREHIPFAVGILMENDLETNMARAAATKAVVSKPFCPASKEEVEEAKKLIDICASCICAVESFGPLNEQNRELMEYAKARGKLQADEILSEEK